MGANKAKRRTTRSEKTSVQNVSDKAVRMVAAPGEDPSRTVARCLLDPATGAAGTVNAIYRGVAQESNINGYIAELQHHAQASSAGDLARSEYMLITQAITLDSLFHTLTAWALNNAKQGGNPSYFETCMRLAFKAQSQSRATNETLAEIKYPSHVAFVRQANIAGGHQQVVNHGAQNSHTRENQTSLNKLLEAQHGERLDTGAPTATVGTDQQLATVGAIDGTENQGG